MKTLAIGAALLAVMATAAWGQVAAPSIAPGTFVTDNPAAIKWGAPSRIGAAYVGARQEDNITHNSTDYAGGFGGIRLVGETAAAALEGLTLQDQESNLHDDQNTASGALALQFGSSLALGLGYASSKQTLDAVKNEKREPSFGISLRLGELWFIGGSVGRESSSHKDALTPANDQDGDRDVVRAGLGLRRGGTVLVHLEAYTENKADFDSKTHKGDGEQTSGGTVEFTFWNLLIGGSVRHTEFHKSALDTSDVTSADLGWAPRTGLALTLHYQFARAQLIQQPTDPKPAVVTQSLGAVLATYQF